MLTRLQLSPPPPCTAGETQGRVTSHRGGAAPREKEPWGRELQVGVAAGAGSSSGLGAVPAGLAGADSGKPRNEVPDVSGKGDSLSCVP